MQKGYFRAAWDDVRQSENWLGKMFLLGLVSLIPIFGQVVLLGYAFGWARDVAWRVPSPLPARIFGNEDGMLYRRGLIVFAISLVCCVFIPSVLEAVWDAFAGRGLSTVSGAVWGPAGRSMLGGSVYSLFSLAVTLLAMLFYQVGSMRASIYGRLGPGFQVRRLWAMMRHDPKGLLRVLGMTILLGIAPVAVVLVACMVLVGVGAAAVAWFTLSGGATMADFVIMIAIGCIVVVVGLAIAVVVSAASAFVTVMQARAMGYWTQQFDVPAWRGQDDPMPFEVASQQTPR